MKNLTVLVVEDDNVITSYLKTQLPEFGYEVIEALNSGLDAIEFCKKERVDLILMDIFLKGEMTGIQAIHKIRERSQIPVVFMTGNQNQELFEEAKKLNPIAYLIKPFNEDTLRTTLDLSLYNHFNDKKPSFMKASFLNEELSSQLMERCQNNVNLKNEQGLTLLMVASGKENLAAIHTLVELGANLNEQDNKGRTALMAAAKNGHCESIKTLIDFGADLEIRDEAFKTVLFHAMENHFTSSTKLILNHGANAKALIDHQNTLMFAAKHGCQSSIFKLLLNAGADPNHLITSEMNLLMWAAQEKHFKLFDTVVENHKDKDLFTDQNMDLILFCIRNGYNTALKKLIEQGIGLESIYNLNNEGKNPLSIAKEMQNPVGAQLLKKHLENTAGPLAPLPILNSEETKGQLIHSLIKATWLGKTEDVKALLESTNDVNVRFGNLGWNGYTLLMKAAKEGYDEIIDLLFQNGANLDEIENRYGMTALMLAAKWDQYEVCKFLIDKSANLDIKSYNHSTALNLALEAHNEKIAILLVKKRG